MIAVAEGGEDYDDALEYARVKADHLNKAQQSGKQITPELKAKTDTLAQSYVMAGLNAVQAADKMPKLDEAGRKGRMPSKTYSEPR